MTMYAGDEFYDDDVTSGVGPYPGKVSSAQESAVGQPSRPCVEPEQGAPSADDGRGLRTCRCSGIYGAHKFTADGCNFGPGRFRFHARYDR